MATVRNISKQTVTIILDHAVFATKAAGWQRTSVQFGQYTEGGARVVADVRRSYPGSLTILPGQSVSDLHPAISKCSQVSELVGRKVLVVSNDEERKGS
jgi:hypothetical protein